MFNEINMDEMEDLRDDMDEMMQDTEYMNEMMNRNYAVDVDEAELDEEMKALDDDLFKDAL